MNADSQEGKRSDLPTAHPFRVKRGNNTRLHLLIRKSARATHIVRSQFLTRRGGMTCRVIMIVEQAALTGGLQLYASNSKARTIGPRLNEYHASCSSVETQPDTVTGGSLSIESDEISSE